jgi:hypothetical protein
MWSFLSPFPSSSVILKYNFKSGKRPADRFSYMDDLIHPGERGQTCPVVIQSASPQKNQCGEPVVRFFLVKSKNRLTGEPDSFVYWRCKDHEMTPSLKRDAIELTWEECLVWQVMES